MGAGALVQLVDGAAPGVLLCWQDPSSSDFSTAGAVVADRPDVSVSANVDSVWLQWPAVLRSTEAVTLRTWNRTPRDVPPAWNRSGREQVRLLAFQRNISCPVASGTTLYDSEVSEGETERAAGDVEVRPYSSLVVQVSVDLSGTVVSNEWNLQLMTLVDGAMITFISEPGSRAQVWMDLQTGASARRVCNQVWPKPFAPYRIRLWNEDALVAGTAHFHIFESTGLCSHFTV